MRSVRNSWHLSLCFLALGCTVSAGAAAAGSAEKALYAFQGGKDGSGPRSALIADGVGDLYGTTVGGGGGTGCQGGQGCGTVFKLFPTRTESVLYAFQGGKDGAFPLGAVVADSSNNLYGTTEQGGGSDQGTVFKIAPDGTETQLYVFTGGNDGSEPVGTLIMDESGSLYGTTAGGGTAGLGTVFKVASAGAVTVIHSFQGESDGAQPVAGVISDGNSNLYGTTQSGGTGNGNNCGGGDFGCGTVFRIAPDGTETVLYSFQGGGSDGFGPESGLLMDAAGDLFGTTAGGGPSDQGTVYKLAPDGTETVLYAFKGGSDGSAPMAAVTMDKVGNLYGTTAFGGGDTHCRHNGTGCGTVFKLKPNGAEEVLFRFGSGGGGGRNPVAALVEAKKGVFYGTAAAGGKKNNGVVFKVKE